MGQVLAISVQGLRHSLCIKCWHGTNWASNSNSVSGGLPAGMLLRQKMQSSAISSPTACGDEDDEDDGDGDDGVMVQSAEG